MNDPIPVVLDFLGQKLQGFIMKINPTGFLVELDQLPFKAGALLKVEFSLPENAEISIEDVRVIKLYDRYFRNPPKPNAPKTGPDAPLPKKLAELHFTKAKETTRQAIMKMLMSFQVGEMKKSR